MGFPILVRRHLYWIRAQGILCDVIIPPCPNFNGGLDKSPLELGYGSEITPHIVILIHWNENVVILTKFESLAALEVVILTTSSAASDENFIKMKTFPFQYKTLIKGVTGK